MKKLVYLHGFSKKEQNRLVDQARFMEPYVYEGVNLQFQKNLLEVGCGVGAQTKILTRRFPDLHVTSVDFSRDQLTMAKTILAPELKEKRVLLYQQDATKLSLHKKNYDAAFVCWFLEHLKNPIEVLKRIKKHMKPGATIYCTEVFNQTHFLEPYSPAYLKYWFEFNDYQWAIGGNPFVGALLGHLLKEAGFVDIRTEIRSFHFDSREPEKRAVFTKFFFDILLSAEENLLKTKRIDRKTVAQMKREVKIVQNAPHAVFFDAIMRATARVAD